jgi:hypothetical protein
MMLLLWLGAIWLAGFGLVRWMFPQPLRWSLHNVLLFSLGIGAGAGIASSVYFLALLLAGPGFTVLASSMGAMVAIGLALGLLARKRGALLDWAVDPDGGPVVPWYVTALFVAAVAVALTMFLSAVTYNPHGDEGAWSIWNLRARFLFRAGAFWRDAFSSDLSWSHLDYPLMLPGLVALCWKLSGRESTDAAVAIAFLFALGTAGLLVSALGALRGKILALLAGTLLLGTGSFVALSTALYGDVPLSFYILAAIALLCLQDRYPDDLRFSALAGLMAGFAAWTRNEGIIFVAALVAGRAIALVRFRERKLLLPQLFRLVLGSAAPLGVVITFKLRLAGPSDVSAVPASAILRHMADPTRWIVTVEALLVELLSFGRFLIPIVLVLALYWYLVRFRVDERDRASLATAVIALALTLVAQLLIDILYVDNLPLEIGTSFERILLQVWPAVLLVFFLASGPLQLAAAQKVARKAKVPAGKRKMVKPGPSVAPLGH